MSAFQFIPFRKKNAKLQVYCTYVLHLCSDPYYLLQRKRAAHANAVYRPFSFFNQVLTGAVYES